MIDAGTGAGKTTAIIDLLKKNVTSCPRFEVEGRKRILYRCNRKALWEQIVQAVLGDGVKRDFRELDLTNWAMSECHDGLFDSEMERRGDSSSRKLLPNPQKEIVRFRNSLLLSGC